MVDGVEEQSRFAGWRREVWLFMKAQLSAQIATVIDFLITILLVKLFGIYYLYATFIGSVVGGIVNCVINYEWVFKAEDCKKIHVGLKYFIVWGGEHPDQYMGYFCFDGMAGRNEMGERLVGILRL